MKRFLRIALALLLCLSALICCIACSEESVDAEKDGEEASATIFAVKYNNITVALGKNADPVLEKLGEPLSSEFVASCGEGAGDQYVYSYSALFIYTVKNGDSEIIDAVKLRDDTASTTKNIRIGSTEDQLKDAYGSKLAEKNGRYICADGEYTIEITLEGGAVNGIEMRTETN